MLNNASKFALGLVVAGLVAAVAATDDKAQTILFVGVVLGAAAVAFGLTRSLGADLAPFASKDATVASTPVDPAEAPAGSAGPLVAAIGATVFACGGALGPRFVIAGLVIAAIGAAVWLIDAFRTPGVVDERNVRNIDNRLLGPIALPVGAFVLAISIAYSFSRVLLAVGETESWVLAFIVAAVLLTVLWVIASRLPATRVVVGAALLGLLGVYAAGGAGAAVGERDFEHEGDEVPSVTMTAQQIKYSRDIIAFPADREVEIFFTNRDVGTFHNVAVYTEGDPGKPLFNGKPVAKGDQLYKFKTPAAGTYRYICDFHPTAMTGVLKVTGS
jgi:plastocyanin